MARGSNNRSVIHFLSFCFALLTIAAAVFFIPQLYVIRVPICRVTHLKLICQDVFNVQKIQVNQDTMYIGLSDGGSPFDMHASDSNSAFKQQAANDYKAGNIQAAIQNWQQAIAATTDDAESMIYIENAQIDTAHQRYVSIIVPTTFSQVVNDNSTSVSVARDDLRGVYLAQRDFNKHNALKVRIILANLGVKDQNYLQQAMPPVLDEIRLLASSDPSVIGVVGFPFSASAKIAIFSLANDNIPIVSPALLLQAVLLLSRLPSVQIVIARIAIGRHLTRTINTLGSIASPDRGHMCFCPMMRRMLFFRQHR